MVADGAIDLHQDIVGAKIIVALIFKDIVYPVPFVEYYIQAIVVVWP